MSRGFWAAIGGIAGFFLGGGVGEAIGLAYTHKLGGAWVGSAETTGDLAAIGAVVGIPWGFAIASSLAGRKQRLSSPSSTARERKT